MLEDPDGCDLPDLTTARREALSDAREILAAYVRDGRVIDAQVFEIVDERGQLLMTVPLRDALNFAK